MALTVGQKLGPYEILASIGAGGMGEVYRARDERLKRDVAIKVLPAAYSSDTDRLRRFEQEAQAAGALNHPNITAVYDIGSHDGAPYIVQELLEGETLRSRLAAGAFTPRRAIGHALQIASGLAAAHTKGIVHRDLKPENIFVTSDGRVKILDFGLAKLTQPEAVGSSATSLPTAAPGTEPGLVMGTVGYMSPEQVRGKFIDARSDIFSFGTILYEMLSGKRAFHGDTTADTMSAILTKEPPDLSETNRRIPDSLERLVRHCLEKSPEARFQAASDIAFDLEAMSAAPLSSGAHPVAPGIGRLMTRAAVLAAILAAAAVGYFLRQPSMSTLPSFRKLTFARGNLGSARFTPDGKRVVYSASWEGRPLEIFTTGIDGTESTPTGLKSAELLSVSTTGELAISLRERYLATPVGPGTLARVPLGGGTPRRLLESAESADWDPSGKDLAVTLVSGGSYHLQYPVGKTLFESAGWMHFPRFSPRGDRIAVVENLDIADSAIAVIDIAGNPKRLLEHVFVNRLAWAPHGREIWFDDAADVDQSSLRAVDLSGKTRTLLRVPASIVLHDIAADGRVLMERFNVETQILFRPSSAASERDFGWFGISWPIALSQDGELILMQVIRGSTRNQLFYLRRSDGSPPVRLGEGLALDLSADGSRVLARGSAVPDGFALVPTGPGSPVGIPHGALDVADHAAFTPDGRGLVVAYRDPAHKTRVYVHDSPTSPPRPVTPEGYSFSGRPLSPDGSRVIASRNTEEEDLSIFPIAGGNPVSVPNSKKLELVVWHPDGKTFWAAETGSLPLRIVRVDAATGRRSLAREMGPADLSGAVEIRNPLMTPTESAYAYAYTRSSTSDLYLVEGLK